MKRKTSNAQRRTPNIELNRAFTLIELLVVIGIIAILLGFIFPVFQGVQDRAKKVQAKNDLTQIVTAVNAYYTEYGKYPIATDDATLDNTKTANLFNTLRAIGTTENTRQIVFISPPEDASQANPKGKVGNTGLFCDPWGQPYKIAIDGNYDNQITPNPYGGSGGAGPDPLRQGVIAWSLGKDKTQATTFTGSDDVISWQ